MSKRLASVVKKRSVRVGTRLTSLTLENEFWEGLKEIAQKQQLPLNTLITDINKHRRHANLSSVLRLFVLEHYARLAAAPAKPKSCALVLSGQARGAWGDGFGRT